MPLTVVLSFILLRGEGVKSETSLTKYQVSQIFVDLSFSIFAIYSLA